MNEFRTKKLPYKKIKTRSLSPLFIIIIISLIVLFSGTFFAYQAITQTPGTASSNGYTKFCEASDIYVSAKYLGLTTGSVLDSVRYTNRSQNTCALKGFPDIKIKDSAGKIYTTNSYSLPMAAKVEILEPAGSAQSFVIWGNWCGSKPSANLELQVQIPGALDYLGARVTDINGNVSRVSPQCTGGKGSQSTLAISPIVSELATK